MTMMPSTTLTPPLCPFKRLTAEEMAERRHAGLCFNCDEPFTRGHKCIHLFNITAINDYNTDSIDNGLMMMIGTNQSAVRSCPPMYLIGVVSGMGIHILVDTGATHNIIDINVTCLIGLREQRIDTTILVGSDNEVPCRVASFSVPLCIDSEVFYIDAFLLDIGNNIDIALGTPWLVSLGRMVGTSPTWSSNTSAMATPPTSPLLDPGILQRRSLLYVAEPTNL